VGSAVDRAALGQVFSKYFSVYWYSFIPPIAPQSSPSITHGWHNRPIMSAVIVDSDPLQPHSKEHRPNGDDTYNKRHRDKRVETGLLEAGVRGYSRRTLISVIDNVIKNKNNNKKENSVALSPQPTYQNIIIVLISKFKKFCYRTCCVIQTDNVHIPLV
jgi:hypothetical protein